MKTINGSIQTFILQNLVESLVKCHYFQKIFKLRTLRRGNLKNFIYYRQKEDVRTEISILTVTTAEILS